MKLIDKEKVVEEIRRIMAEEMSFFKDCSEDELEVTSSPVVYTRMEMLLSFLNTLEVKEIETTKTPKHSYFETIYHCGAEPIWKVGDILATYECYSDREGEYVYGEVIDVKNGENDWIYTMKGDLGEYEDVCEKELISQEAYKKNK